MIAMNSRVLRSIAAPLGLVALLSTSSVASHGDAQTDWPGWRGPLRDGISTESAWKTEGKAEALWSMDLGLGYSAVAISGGRLYSMGYDPEAEVDLVWCLDAETGEELWVFDYPAKIWDYLHGGGTLSTPTIDGAMVYTANREGMVYCFEGETGEVRWSVDMKELAGAKPGTWGFSASPIIDGEDLILNVGKVAVLDKHTGELKWTSKEYGHSYSTPALFDLNGTPAMAVFNSNGLSVIEREAGKERFFHEWKTKYDINAATPHVLGDRIFISSGLNRGCALLKMEGIGTDKERFDVVWENKSMSVKMSGCVLIDEHLYGFDETLLRCIDLEGNVAWSQRGLGNGALSAAGDRLIIMSSKGELIIAKATPEAYQELSKTKVIDTGKVFWTVPVLLDGRIYCRGSNGTLVCRDHR